MIHHGFVRAAAFCPVLRVADPTFNAERIVEQLAQADTAIAVFPELSLTGYTCADLFQHSALLEAALAGLGKVVEASRSFPGLVAVGLPLAIDDQVFNCAAVLHTGTILGIVPKSFIPNYKEFYEARWFSPAATA